MVGNIANFHSITCTNFVYIGLRKKKIDSSTSNSNLKKTVYYGVSTKKRS